MDNPESRNTYEQLPTQSYHYFWNSVSFSCHLKPVPLFLFSAVIRLFQVRTKDREFSSVQELVAYHTKNSLPIISSGSQVTIIRPVHKH